MSFFAPLPQQPADALLALIGLYRDDPRAHKLDLGVGVYRDEAGRTPVMAALKQAEKRLWESQDSKSYLGPEGNAAFTRHMRALAFGAGDFGGRITGVQTPGGTGALRLAAELLAAAKPGARVFVGTPTWPNHPPLLAAARLTTQTYTHFDVATQRLCFDEMMAALGTAQAGDVALLHGCCHNPTGADLDGDQWAALADLLADRGIVPLLDLAYQGLGHGMDADAAGVRLVLDKVPEALIAYSCDKNFGVYRERVGALFALTAKAADADRVNSNLLSLARANWSMPPDHGAAAIALLMEDPDLVVQWRTELDGMRDRLRAVRDTLAAHGGALAHVAEQNGMFSQLPLSPPVIARLRAEHGIYMAGSGRINIAGLTVETAGRFAQAIAACV
ncbi:aromatic amino acid transaminase [Niveispirillum irakense]|uniref:amino acid aminotransferase n=1 Tax=Niveispirillum irakense TaxID=34011 RepID=UPI000410710B|nr:amino acid aminotransferase [Niveispirillum irakense]